MTCRSSLTPQTGVGFGAAGAGVKGATFAKARNLAIGIGIQNFPEGLAVSLPLHRAGFSKMRAFWYGQMSGMVEPVAGILGVSNVPPFHRKLHCSFCRRICTRSPARLFAGTAAMIGGKPRAAVRLQQPLVVMRFFRTIRLLTNLFLCVTAWC